MALFGKVTCLFLKNVFPLFKNIYALSYINAKGSIQVLSGF